MISKKFIALIIIILFGIGGFFRFYNLNWDQGHYFHPDERNIANAVVKIHFFDHLDPEFFAYGGLSIYLYRAAGEVMVSLTHDPTWLSDWGKIDVIGRFFSALFASLTIIPLYFLGRRVFNQKLAIITITLWTFAPSAIQTAHFDVTESILTLLIVVIALLSVELLEKPSIKKYSLTGAVLGLSLAAKTTAISFLAFPGVAWLVEIFKNRRFHLGKIWHVTFLLEAMIIIFLLFSPYTVINNQKFLESMDYESGVVTGRLIVPYTLQFTNTPPYLYQLINTLWQVGPIALLFVPGIIFLLLSFLKTKNLNFLLLLSFPLAYFAYIGSWHTKFIRYMLPILPFFVMFAVYILTSIHTKVKWLGTFLILIFIIPSIYWGVAFFTIYTRPQTRITASEWIYQNIPAGSYLLTEHWDDGLPIDIPHNTPAIYRIEQLKIYDPDNIAKTTYMAEHLSQGNYLIFNSRRLYGTLMYLPDKYPIMSKYYRLLFADQLGYQRVAEFTSYPQLLGLTINDDKSEETFQVYDHPKVMIYKNVSHYPASFYENILAN
ncbi:glycosyltransferase family 39 protein [Patescibacteria group bacterium]|nr:glycosyltransferase family 39 protein [Patescibacteria group bacterium]MCL5409277.1 glycosyltransferase family 39 protein [Patescibacteria group bacterium]